MYSVGHNPYQGLFTKADFKRGKGATPGTVVANNIAGDTKSYVAVKLGAATWINGTVIQIDTGGGGGASAAVVTAPATLLNGRVGVLVFASATATQTMDGTAYGWAQIYGEALARVQVATVSIPGVQMILASLPGQLRPVTAGLASAQADIEGITALATGSVNSLLSVFLNYPRLTGPFDLNLS